jgi:crotonobetaine/carnitine-CoA ligase
LLEGSPKLPQVAREVTHKMIASLTYTSGTTGPSKGVMIPHYYLYVGATLAIEAADIKANDVCLVCTPFFHGNAKFLQIYPAMLTGSKAVVYPRFSASEFWGWVRRHKVTRANLVGVMMPFLLKQPPREDDGDNPMEICLLAPNPPEMTEQFLKRFNLKKYYAAFGQSETSLIAIKRWDEEVPPGSPGKINSRYFDVRVFDENDEEVPAGTPGEIVIRPKEPFVMSMGFFNKPEKTAEAFQNCWFHTGDGGYIDKEGHFYFTDRIKDYIRRRGENVSSMEVEGAIGAHPNIKATAVIGVDTEYGGLEQEIMAYIVLQDGAEMKPEELMKWCEGRLPYYVIPRYIEFVEDLPRTPSERVEKYKLRKLGLSEKTWDREKAGYQIKR